MSVFVRPSLRYAAALFVLSFSINLACFNWAQAPILYPDSRGYIEPAKQLRQGRFPDFSLRWPTYPFYLFVTGLFGNIVNRSPQKLAVYGQIVLGAVSIVLLYLIVLSLLKRASLAFLVGAVLAFNFQVIDYQSVLLTESVATTLLLAVLYAHVAAVSSRITFERFLAMLILDSLLVMIRPSFIFLPASLYVLHIGYLAVSGMNESEGNRRSSLPAFGMLSNLVLATALIGLYYWQTGHLGLSKTAAFNLLGKAIQYGYLDENVVNPPPLARRAQEIYRELKPNRDPYTVINQLRREGLYSAANLEAINSYFLAGHRTDFTIQTTRLAIEIVTRKTPFHYGRPDGLSENPLLYSISQAINRLHALNGKALIFACGFALYLIVQKRKTQSMAVLMILCVVVYHLAGIAGFGYSEYPRLRAPIDLLLNLLVLLPFSLFACYAGERLKIFRSGAAGATG
jgi:hypothetical protein